MMFTSFISLSTSVPPLIDLVPLELPILTQPPSNEINTTATTVSVLSVGPGDSVQWTCSVQAGLGDRLIWSLDGLELSKSAAKGDSEQVLIAQCTAFLF